MFPSIPSPWRGSVLLALLASVAGAPRFVWQDTPATPVSPLPIGINLRPITPFDSSLVFADAMKMASEWSFEVGGRQRPTVRQHGLNGKPTPVQEVVPLDANGWPRVSGDRAVSCQFFVGMRGRFPAGEYVVTWKGKGTLEFRGGVGIVSQAPNRLVVEVDGVNGGQPGLELSNMDPADPIRDIRVWLPGHEDSCHSFHPLFLERLRPFSVLRFYPWMKVYSTSGRWSERSTLFSARQGSGEGVAAEFMVELCNELTSDPWFCMPHLADDDYVRRFALLVRDSLRHDARVYVEFSNETWNTDYAAGKWAREQSQLRGIPAMKIVAERAAQVFDIWHEVFGSQKNRIVRVAGVQLHNPGIANVLCRALDGKFDAMALGTYFGARADRDDVGTDSTAQELMAAARANLVDAVLPRTADHRALADTLGSELGRHIALLTYEGGQSIVARSPGGGLGVQATLDCQVLPEMFTAYRDLIEGVTQAGVELFVAYDFTGPRGSADTFSVLEYIDEPIANAPKYRALIQGWESRGQ